MATGYNVKVDRDTLGDISALTIQNYIDGRITKPRGQETSFVSSDLFENPEITSGLSIDIVIADDATQTTADTDYRAIYSDTEQGGFGMLGVGGLIDPETAPADINTEVALTLALYAHFTDRAGRYDTSGFKATVDTTSFSVGDALDTANKIRNYQVEVIEVYMTDVFQERETFVGA